MTIKIENMDFDEDQIKEYAVVGAVVLAIVCIGCCVFKKCC